MVRLSTPRTGDTYAPPPTIAYTLAGTITGAGQDESALALRGCGDGCFVAPAQWRDGNDVVTLRAAAPGWRGDTVSLLLAWPPRPGADDLVLAVAALRGTGRVTVYESVTSDTSTGPPAINPLAVDGDFFVSQQPCASGGAPQVVAVGGVNGPVRLALGLPAAAMTVALVLDYQGRIAEQTLTDATHLVHSRFVYPEP